MRKDSTWQWTYTGLAAALLIAGLFHLGQGSPLGWAAVISAVLLLIGVVVWRRWPRRYRGGRFMRVCGVYAGIIWFIALIFGVLGWAGEFSWGAWGAGIGVAIFAVWGADPDAGTAGGGTDAATRPNPARQGTAS
jgi:O-antigen/teichoic acid export membrane protein